MEALLVAIVLLSAVALFGSENGIGLYRQAVDRIGRDAEPTVVTAEKLTVALAEMDTEIADSALGNEASWAQYVADTNEISALLIRLSRDVRYSEAETAGLVDLVAQLRAYYQKVGGSSANSAEIVGSNEQLSMTTTLWASRLLRGDLIPKAQIIKSQAGADLASAYADYRQGALTSLGLALAPLLLLLGALLLVQFMLIRRTHRLISVPLALVTVLLTAYIGWFGYTMVADRAALAAAKEDFFDDLKIISDTKIAAQLMKADESMWLLEYRHVPFEQRHLREHYTRAFLNSAVQLLDCANVAGTQTVPDRNTRPGAEYTAVEALSETLARCAPVAAKGSTADLAAAPAGFAGPLADALQRGTETGRNGRAASAEDLAARQAASAAIVAFLDFLRIDQQIRTLMLNGERAKAVQLSTGRDAGESNGAFSALAASLDRLIGLDQAGFEQGIDAAARHIALMSGGLNVVLIATLLGTALGLWPRYREYI
jgi:hypothetical protein